jgi:hypothetical protein
MLSGKSTDGAWRMTGLFKNHQWRITDYGIESVVDHNPDHFAPNYFIEASRLSELDWPEHMAEKTWVDIEAFIEAYDKALDLHQGKYSGAVSKAQRASIFDDARRHAQESR